MAMSTDTIPGTSATAAGAFSEQQLATQLAGLDALEQAAHGQSASLARRVWRATWPKLAAIGLALFAWQRSRLERLAADLCAAGSDHGPRAVLRGSRRARDVEGRRDDAAPRCCRLRVGRGRGGRHRSRGLAVQVVAHCSRLAHHGPTDDAVDRWFPLALLLFRLSEGAIMFVVVIGAAPSIANGLISGIDHVPPLLTRAGRVLGAPRAHRLPPCHHPRRVAVVPHRAEAGMGVPRGEASWRASSS